MTRLTFRYTPRDTVDFDVCAGPPRPEALPSVNKATPARASDAKKIPEPAEG